MKENNGNYSSNIVGNILTDNNNQQVGAANGGNYANKVLINNGKNNKKVIWIAAGLVLLILVVVEIILIVTKKDDDSSKTIKDETLYDIAYNTMNFKEDKDLTKVDCLRKNKNSGDNVIEEDRRIVYFKGNNIETVIDHRDIKLSGDYESYFDTMYKEYEDSLKNDYKYDNVDTNITKGENELLTTIIIYNKGNGEKKLGFPEYVSVEDAKKTMIDGGYSCK